MARSKRLRIQQQTVEYYVEDAQHELNKVVKACKSGLLDDAAILPWMEHAFHMLNAAFNMRYLTRERISKMSHDEWEAYLNPPKEIFSSGPQ